jgi:hypothetical protein
MQVSVADHAVQGVQVDEIRLVDHDVAPGVLSSGGPQNDVTQRNTTFMTWNLMHVAAMLKRSGGIPAHGNQRSAWDAGARFDHPNPEYR